MQSKCNHQTNKYYMNLLDIIFLAIALAMDCFAVSIVSGVLGGGVLRMAFFFGFFQAMMPLLGWLGISYFSTQLEAYDHWIAFSLLLMIGCNMIREAFSSEEEEHQHFNPNLLRTQLLLAIATSIDALAVGISFACTGYQQLSQLVLPLVIIGGLFPFQHHWQQAWYAFRQGHRPSPEARASGRCHSYPDWCEDSRFPPVRIVFCKKTVSDRWQKEKIHYLCNRNREKEL